MRALRGATEVRTAYAGGFVQGMLGRESDPDGPADWFYFVNGISVAGGRQGRAPGRRRRGLVGLPRLGRARLDAGRGRRVARAARHRRRTATRRPSPPTRPLAAALAAAGATLTPGASPWRARVGASDALAARDPAWRRALADPDGAGLTVTVDDGRILALAPDGSRRAAGARAPGR